MVAGWIGTSKRWWLPGLLHPFGSRSSTWRRTPRRTVICTAEARSSKAARSQAFPLPLRFGFAFVDFREGRPLVDREVVGLVALDDVLRLVFGSVPLVALEGDLGGHFLLNGSADPSRFRIPLNMISSPEVAGHDVDLQKRISG